MSAVAAQHEYVQDLLDAFRQCCQVWDFSPDPRNLALVLGNSVRVWGILACAQYLMFIYLRAILEHFAWQLWWYNHLAPSGCPALRASPVVAGFAIF